METNAESRKQVEIPLHVTKKRRTKVPSSLRCSSSSRQHVTTALERIEFLKKRMFLVLQPKCDSQWRGYRYWCSFFCFWTYYAAERKEEQEEPKTARPRGLRTETRTEAGVKSPETKPNHKYLRKAAPVLGVGCYPRSLGMSQDF